jgi:RND family efflux transporter MFP subunit
MRISFFILLLVAAGAMSGCGEDKSQTQLDEGQPITVSTTKVVAKETQEPVIYSAIVEAGDRAEIATKVMGKVEGIYVKEGQFVKAGQLLVKLSSRDVDAKLQQTEAKIEAANVMYENAEKNYQRFQSLFSQSAATQKELDDVKMAYQNAKAQKVAAEGMKKEIEELISYVRMRAPFNGVVADKYVDIGDLATPGMPVIVVERMSSLDVTASIPESEIEFITQGMPVEVIIPGNSVSLEDRIYKAKITRVVPSANPMSHQFKIKAKLTNPDGSIKPGMFARIAIAKSRQKTFLVPKSAVFQRGQLEGIYVVNEDSRASLRWIRLGRSYGNYVEVLSGLDSGESIVLDQNASLKDFKKVKAVNQ